MGADRRCDDQSVLELRECQGGRGDDPANDPEGAGADRQQLGCSKCRYSAGGCGRCRNPHFRPRKGSIPQEELAAMAQQQRRSARRRREPGSQGSGAAAAAAADGSIADGSGRTPKRRRRAAAASAVAPPAAAGPGDRFVQGQGESLVSQLRRHLGQASEPASAATSEGLAERLQQLHTWARDGPAAATGTEPPAFMKRFPMGAGGVQPGAPFVAGVATARSQRGDGAAEAAPSEAHMQQAGQQSGRKRSLEEDTCGAPAVPQSLQRPAKQRRAGQHGQQALVAPAQRAKRARSPSADVAAGAPPRRYRRVLPEPASQQGQREAAQQGGARASLSQRADSHDAMAADGDMEVEGLAAAGSAGGGSDMSVAAGGGGGAGGLDVELASSNSSEEEQGSQGQGTSTAGAGSGLDAAAGRKRSFLDLLEANMQMRRQERRESGAGAAPLPQLLQELRTAKRQRRDQQQQQAQQPGAIPAVSLGLAPGRPAAAGAEPDPRLCLWEPPVSPYGLLEEELYDDPWKLLVACMLLNKTSGKQVRKVIWDLFLLCPTPAAATSADVAAIQTLIQPLGLFRKRAVAIQKLSRDYLEKQWRDPQELHGIGKYAADAYYMFCRGRWHDVAPEDKDLLKYRQWLESTQGLGSGLTRHRTVPPPQQAT
ncbi:hypothetical protein N2152v2_009400 [Parachlorella kessleri]